MKCIKYLLLVFLFCFSFPVSLQTYYITNQQLQNLETIYQDLKTNKQTLQSQLNELKIKCENLNEQLTKQRELSTSLNLSCSELENKLLQIQEKHNETVEHNYKLKSRNLKLLISCVIVVILFIVSLIINIKLLCKK